MKAYRSNARMNATRIVRWFALLVVLSALFTSSGRISDEGPSGSLLEYAFVDPLGPMPQLYPPISDLDEIREINNSMLLPVKAFYTAYDSLEILSAGHFVSDQDELVRVDYELTGKVFSAFAYVRRSFSDPAAPKRSILVIPGSGHNQSYAIQTNDPENYHYGIVEAIGSGIDLYTFIKPNEDALAFHNGKAKLSLSFFVNWQLNHGGSYSAHYIANSLAITRYLQSQYDEVIVAGLSQGGEAALLNAIQSEPTAVIVSSGFSIIAEDVLWSDHNQLIIPGLRERWPIDHLRERIARSRSRYLFTYGRSEVGIYKLEAEEQTTCKWLAGLENVACHIHDGGHEFPVGLISTFLNSPAP